MIENHTAYPMHETPCVDYWHEGHYFQHKRRPIGPETAFPLEPRGLPVLPFHHEDYPQSYPGVIFKGL